MTTPGTPPIGTLREWGNAFRDEIANLMEKQLEGTGMAVHKEVYKDTPYGKRYIDVEIRDSQGKPIGGIETKLGNARYDPDQRRKDEWLLENQKYKVNVARSW